MDSGGQGELIGAIKIKDGLFIGDEMAAQDLEFVWANKVTHIINCAGRQVANHWEPIGVIYQTYYWLDQDNQIILDTKDSVALETFEFVEKALQKAESVLVHSVKGQSRSSCIICAYLMRKYRWTLLKTLEFLNSRRPELEMRASFIHQLSTYESRLVKAGLGPKTSKWNELADPDASQDLESEELLLRNTFVNAQMGPLANYAHVRYTLHDTQEKLRWADLAQGYAPGSAVGKKKLAVINLSKDLLNKKKVPPVVVHHKVRPDMLKPALKGAVQRTDSKRAVTPPPKKPGSGMVGAPPQRMGSARVGQKASHPEETHKVYYNNFLSGPESKTSGKVDTIESYANYSKPVARSGNFTRYEPVLGRSSNLASEQTGRSLHGQVQARSEDTAGKSDSLSEIRKLQESLNQVLRIGNSAPPTNVASSGVTNIINNNNINNYYIQKEQYSSPLLTAGTEQPAESLDSHGSKYYVGDSKADRKPKRPSTAGPPPQERQNSLLQDDFVSGLKTSYKPTRSSLDRQKVTQSSTDSLRKEQTALSGGGYLGNAGQKKRESSLRKSADSKSTSGPNFGAGVFSTGQKRIMGPVAGEKKQQPQSSALNPMMGSGFTSDRTSNSARSQQTSSTQASQSVAINIGNNTYRGSQQAQQTATTMSGYNPSSSRSTTSQVGMNSFRSGPVKATTEAIDFAKCAGSASFSAASSVASRWVECESRPVMEGDRKRQKMFAQNRPPSPGSKGTSDQPYNIYPNPNKDKMQTAKNKYRMRSISPGQQQLQQQQNTSASIYSMRGYSPSKPRWKF